MTNPFNGRIYSFVTAVIIILFAAAILIILIFPRRARGDGPAAVAPAVLERHIKILSRTFHPRCYDQPANLKAAAAYIAANFQAAGGRTAWRGWTAASGTASGATYYNITADFGPETGPLIVVGAHYDAAKNEGLCSPGADDNASGVAALLALAELLGAEPPSVRVQLAAYSLEEPPFFRSEFMGSAVHAADLARAGQSVAGVIVLEMLGYFSDAPGSQTFPAEAFKLLYPDTGNFLAVVGRVRDRGLTGRVERALRGASDLPIRSVNLPAAVPGVDYSDHRSYWPYGYEAVMITDTAFYRNPAYHQAGDTADKLDYGRLAQAVLGVFAAVSSLAEAGGPY